MAICFIAEVKYGPCEIWRSWAGQRTGCGSLIASFTFALC